MRNTASVFALMLIAAAVLFSLSSSVKPVQAAVTDYRIETVNHNVAIMYNGYVLVNDTIEIVGEALNANATLERFQVGFPQRYGDYVLRCLVYGNYGAASVSLNVPFQDRMRFYGVEVVFQQPLSVDNGTQHVFTLATLFSNSLLEQNAGNSSLFTLDFPMHLGLTSSVALFNASIVPPTGAIFQSGTVQSLNYTAVDLPAFSYSPANVTFALSGDKILPFDVKEFTREIRANGFGDLDCSDTYHITNRSPNAMSFVEVLIPMNASSLSVVDQFGRTLTSPTLMDRGSNRYKITYLLKPSQNESTMFTVMYSLPSSIYQTKQVDVSNGFKLDFLLFKNITYYVERASVAFVFPEGGRLIRFDKTSVGDDYSVSRGVFQETLTVSKQDVISSDSFNFSVVYEHNPLWLAFRPALWAWALSLVGCAIVVVARKPEAPAEIAVPSAAVKLRLDDVRAFAESYEEKMKIMTEIDSLEARVQKGKIPRRRYKVQRKTLETRLGALSRGLAEYKDKMRTTGGHYSELMLQLEVAESEIKGADDGIKSIEGLHNSGELSLEAYRKRLDDYKRRKEKAQTTINGVLLRLREEIR